jgi:hypothetical protein
VYDRQYKNDNLRGTLGGIGIVTLIPAIPLYLAYDKNRRKANAMTIRFKNQQILFPQGNNLVLTSQPALSFTIGL